MEKKTKKKEKKKKKEKEGRIGGKTIILFVVFGISLLPFVLSPFENLFIQENDYSIFNNGLKGSSIFFYKAAAESGHIPLTITSSLNSLYILPSKNTILVEIAPVQFFDPFEIITLLNFVGNGGKLLLASNFGTGSELILLNNLMSSYFVDPVKETMYDLFLNFTRAGFNISKVLEDPFFTDPNKLTNFIFNEVPLKSPKFSYWIENGIYSAAIYDDNNSNNAVFLENLLVNEIPYGMIITDIRYPYNGDPYNDKDDEVDKILVTRPTPLNLGIDFGISGWENLLKSGEKNPLFDAIENITGVPFDISNTYEINAAILDMLNNQFNITTSKIIAKTNPTSWVDANANYFHDIMDSNGSFWISCVSANQRIIITTQPQIFTNLFAFSEEYDNDKFAMNLLNNLANNTPHFVVFDESKQQKVFPSFFGLILRFINASSGFILLVPVLPLLFYALVSRWIPKIEKTKIIKKSKIVKTKGESIFSERMKWFKRKRQYNKAISLLYRRFKRNIIQSINIRSYDPNQIIEIIKDIKPHVNITRLKRDLTKFERVDKKLMKITNPTTFLQAFNEMKWCYDQIK